MRRLTIEHLTEYRFDASVQLLPHRLVLRPREGHHLRIVSSRLDISPTAHVRWQRDALDNSIAVLFFPEAAELLRIRSEVMVENFDMSPLDFLVAEHAVRFPFQYQSDELLDLAPFMAPSWPGDAAAVGAWLQSHALTTSRGESFTVLDQLNRSIARELRYEWRDEPGVQSPAVTLARGSGSCRDFAALFVEACRYLRFAARFVSGYHTTYEREVGPGSTHAWAEVYLPGPGWKGFDPTGSILTGSDHIATAVARHPEAVPPVSGSFLASGPVSPTMHVSVRVLPA